jgi:hypothetical protein
MDSNFTVALPHPFYGDHVLYHAYNLRPSLPVVPAWEFKAFQATELFSRLLMDAPHNRDDHLPASPKRITCAPTRHGAKF